MRNISKLFSMLMISSVLCLRDPEWNDVTDVILHDTSRIPAVITVTEIVPCAIVVVERGR